MKSFVNVLFLLALSCGAPLALAQSGSQLMRSFEHRVPGVGSRQMHLVQVTNSQRNDLTTCMAATKQVEQIVDQMTRIGRPWGRGHMDYSRQDLMALSNREQVLDAALSALTTSHDELRKSLAGLSDRAVEQRLQKLERLRAKLYSGSSQIGRDLSAARPGPGSPELSWDVYAVKKAANRWQAAHKQIARELDLVM
jgi:hypothetical protein